MGKFSRDKGARFEREVVKALVAKGIEAERVPLSGAAGGSFGGDIIAVIDGEPRTLELKKRAAGFRQLYQWLEGNYGLVIGADREPPLVVIRLKDFKGAGNASD